MAERKRKLTVTLTDQAERDLEEIWFWNAKTYGVEHANEYRRFLVSSARKLPGNGGRSVAARPGFSFHILRRKAKGHGHIAVYRLLDEVIEVLHFFHTAQDWQSRLGDDES